jgi:hypothetical protein
MENKEIVKKLNELRPIYIEKIDASQDINYTSGLASNYDELINIISELLQTSVKALDELPGSPKINISELEFTVSEVIVIALKLLPLSEMQFIDEALKLLDNENTASQEHRGK